MSKQRSLGDLIQQARTHQAELEQEDLTERKAQSSQLEPQSDPLPLKKVGRPRGRRSDQNYTQISALIPLALYQKVQLELVKERIAKGERSGTDVSGLIEQLLTEWVEARD